MTLIFRSRLNETAVMVLCGILKLKFLGVNMAYACLRLLFFFLEVKLTNIIKDERYSQSHSQGLIWGT